MLPDPRTCPWCLRPLGFCRTTDRGGYRTHYPAECSSYGLALRTTAEVPTIWDVLLRLRSVPVRV